MYYVYILKGNKYYCGYTNDVKRRIDEHKRGNTKTTKWFGIHTLIGYFVVQTQKEALILERKIKDSWHIERRTKNENFIQEGLV